MPWSVIENGKLWEDVAFPTRREALHELAESITSAGNKDDGSDDAELSFSVVRVTVIKPESK